MGTAEADREAQAFVRRAAWVIAPIWVALMAATVALGLSGNGLVFVSFSAVIVLTVGWNVTYLLKVRRLRATHQGVVDQTVGVVGHGGGGTHPVERSVVSRLLLGLHAIGWSTPVQASSPEPLVVVHEQLAGLAAREGAPFTWRLVPEGVAVEWKVHPSGIRNRIFMICEGVLRQEVSGSSFVGCVRPDAMTRLFMLHLVVFGVGGIVAIGIAIGGLALGTGAREGFVFALLWGSFGTGFTAFWTWSHAKSYETHERILRAVFGQRVNLAPPH